MSLGRKSAANSFRRGGRVRRGRRFEVGGHAHQIETPMLGHEHVQWGEEPWMQDTQYYQTQIATSCPPGEDCWMWNWDDPRWLGTHGHPRGPRQAGGLPRNRRGGRVNPRRMKRGGRMRRR